jgi:hypothetical protein
MLLDVNVLFNFTIPSVVKLAPGSRSYFSAVIAPLTSNNIFGADVDVVVLAVVI